MQNKKILFPKKTSVIKLFLVLFSVPVLLSSAVFANSINVNIPVFSPPVVNLPKSDLCIWDPFLNKCVNVSQDKKKKPEKYYSKKAKAFQKKADQKETNLLTVSKEPVVKIKTEDQKETYIPKAKYEMVLELFNKNIKKLPDEAIVSQLPQLYGVASKSDLKNGDEKILPKIPAWYEPALEKELAPLASFTDLLNKDFIETAESAKKEDKKDWQGCDEIDNAFKVYFGENDLPLDEEISKTKNSFKEFFKNNGSLAYETIVDELTPDALAEAKDIAQVFKKSQKLSDEGAPEAGVLYMGLKYGAKIIDKLDFILAGAVSETMNTGAEVLEAGVNTVNKFNYRADDGISATVGKEPPNRFLMKHGDPNNLQFSVNADGKEKKIDVERWEVVEMNGEKYYVAMNDIGNPQPVLLKYNKKPWYSLFSKNTMEVYEANINQENGSFEIKNIKKLETVEM